MSKRKITALVVSIIAVAAMAIGSTLAYFTSNDNASNSFVMGNVAIDLKESSDGKAIDDASKVWSDTGLSYEGKMPGDEITKLAIVEVDEDSADCYVRIHMDIDTSNLTNAADIALIENAIKEAAVANDFVVGTNGYYYYDGTASAEDILVFLTGFTLPLGIEDDSQNGTFSIDLTADAIQAANITFGDTNVDFFANYQEIA